jgi:general secretion pathway protein L
MTSSLQTAAEHSRRFLLWWGAELADLVPPALKRWPARESRRSVLALEETRLVHYQEEGGKRARLGAIDLEAGEAALPAAVVKRGPVGLRLPHAACLVRRLDLPAAARRDFAKILQLDLERSTPFRPEEVYFDWFAEEGGGRDGRIGVRQVLAKRSAVDPLLQQLAARGLTIDFVDCWDEAGKTALPVDLLRSGEAEAAGNGGRRLRPAAIFGLAAIVLAGSAVAVALGKYEAALERLEAESAAARTQALAVRRSLDGTEAALGDFAEIRRLKAERPPLIGTIAELTKLLPDDAWVRYLKVEGDVVDVTVMAPKTAELLPVLSGSSFFGTVSLSAPVTYDAADGTERAAVRMRLQPPAREVGSAEAAERPG